MVKRKKGDVTAPLLMIIILFTLAVCWIVLSLLGYQFKDIIETTALNNSLAAPTITSGMDVLLTSSIPNGFIILFAFLIIGIIVSSFLIRIHPVFLFLYIIFAGLTLFVGVFLGNAYQKISEVEAFADIISTQTIPIWIMQNNLKIMLAVAALSMIIIFSKIVSKGGTDRL